MVKYQPLFGANAGGRSFVRLTAQYTRKVRLSPPSDEESRRRLRKLNPDMKDGVVWVKGEFDGWGRTNANTLGAYFRNPLTNARRMYALDLVTHEPRRCD